MAKHRITRADIMAMDDYARQRKQRRKALAETKKHRRVAVGPFATFYFESYDTIWMQIHEMLFIEKGGEPQIADELSAYNPLIPNGRELVATLMIEIPDEAERRRKLATLGGVEETIELRIGEDVIKAEAERDIDRTTAAGKASAVHFVHFPFSNAQIAAFRDAQVPASLAITHTAYGHSAAIPPEVRAALAEDFNA